MSLDEVIFTLAGQTFTLGQILLIPTVLVVGYLLIHWTANLITRRMQAREVQADVVHLVRRIFFIVGLIILLITTLELLNVPLTAFAFISGAVAIGVGFGAQNIINNFISGWILMWEKPIRIGDFLELGQNLGTVEEINTRSTKIQRVDGIYMLVPNSALLETTVVNWTLVDNPKRTQVRVGVAYGSPVQRVAELILQATAEQQSVVAEPPPQVIFDDFGENALVFDVYLWVQLTPELTLREVRSDIRFRLVELFTENAIAIALPQRDLHVDGALTVYQTGSEHSS